MRLPWASPKSIGGVARDLPAVNVHGCQAGWMRDQLLDMGGGKDYRKD